MLLAIVAAILVCALRIGLLFRPVEYSRADETVYVMACHGVRPGGVNYGTQHMRCGYFGMGKLAIWLQRRMLLPVLPHAALAGLSTFLGCLACAAWLGAGWQTVLCVGASPLMLGLGRRALMDVPLVGIQCLVLLLASVCPVAAAALVFFQLTVKESSFSSLPGMAIWATVSGAPWWPFVVGLVAWALWRRENLRWLRPTLDRRENDYARQFCRGGWLRLLTDLTLLSPVAILGAVWRHDARLLAVAAVVCMYGLPWLQQQIRSCLLADILLRVIAAPFWFVMLPVDVYVFYRVWWRGRTYDPTHANLSHTVGMQ